MEVGDLTEEQSNALSHFRVKQINEQIFEFSFCPQEFTHIDSVETCRQYLAAHEWDVERAIETALVSNSDLPLITDDDDERITTDPIPSAPPLPSAFLHHSTPRRSVSDTIPTNQNTENPIL